MAEEGKDVPLESLPGPVVVDPPKDPAELTPKDEKTVPYERFKEVNDELAKLKKEPVKVINKALGVDDYIDISAALEGLDPREKQYLANRHKETGKQLAELRGEEDFSLWQTAYRAKVEKENSLKPSNKQPEVDSPKSVEDFLRGATMEEKEKFLTENNLLKQARPRADRVDIGGRR